MLKPSLISCIQNAAQFVPPNAWVWVDGVCIDQGDESEKAQQVKLLWKLFGDADEVVMYLGEGDSDSALAMAALMEAAFLRQRWMERERCEAVRRLLGRPWFTRLWTMQEAVLARQLLVCCGDKSVIWEDVAYVYDFVEADGPASGLSVTDSHSVGAIISLRRGRAEEGEANAQYCTTILGLMVSQDCFLEVDRVYAVLGLFPPEVMSKIDVNYSYKHRMVYWEKYMQFCGGLVLCLGRKKSKPVVDALRAIAASTHRCPGNVPGWCPDFSNPKHGSRKESVEDAKVDTRPSGHGSRNVEEIRHHNSRDWERKGERRRKHHRESPGSCS